MTAHTFKLVLNSAASVDDLERWLAGAAPGERVIYASGLGLLRDAAGVQLVSRWIDEGLVVPTQFRDPAQPVRFLFQVQKSCGGIGGLTQPDLRAAGCCIGHPAPTSDETALLALLRHIARQRSVPVGCAFTCPSNSELAAAMGLADPAGIGRRRAGHLLARLSASGLIAIEHRGRNAPRLVMVVEKQAHPQPLPQAGGEQVSALGREI